MHVLPTSLLQPLMRLAQSFVMARPDMPDCPIVYASQRFLDLTGYPRYGFPLSLSHRSCDLTDLSYTYDAWAFNTIRDRHACGVI